MKQIDRPLFFSYKDMYAIFAKHAHANFYQERDEFYYAYVECATPEEREKLAVIIEPYKKDGWELEQDPYITLSGLQYFYDSSYACNEMALHLHIVKRHGEEYVITIDTSSDDMPVHLMDFIKDAKYELGSIVARVWKRAQDLKELPDTY